MMPSTSAAHWGTYPLAGVATTRPAIVPEQKPTMDHLRSMRKSSRHHTMPDIAPAIIEFQIAMIARRFAPNALPPLNPSQPNQSTNVPSATSDTLCGRKLRSSRSLRRPSAHEYASPEMPLAISTGPPPAFEVWVSMGAQEARAGDSPA